MSLPNYSILPGTAEAGCERDVLGAELGQTHTVEEAKAFIFCIRMGTALMAYGQTPTRVETVTVQCGKALGIEVVADLQPQFSLFSLRGGPSHVIRCATGIQVDKCLEVMNLAQRVVAGDITNSAVADSHLEAIHTKPFPYPRWGHFIIFVGKILLTTVVSFGGSGYDFLAMIPLSVVLGLLILLGKYYPNFQRLELYLAPLMVGFALNTFAYHDVNNHLCEYSLIKGGLLYWLPGIEMIYASVSMAQNRYQNGAIMMAHAGFQAVLLSVMTSIGLTLSQSIWSVDQHKTPLLETCGAPLPFQYYCLLMIPCSMFLCMGLNVSPRHLPLPMLITLMAVLPYKAAQKFTDVHPNLLNFFGTFLLSVLAGLYRALTGYPRVIAQLPGILFFAPGGSALTSGLRAAYNLGDGNIWDTVVVSAMAYAAGLVLAEIFMLPIVDQFDRNRILKGSHFKFGKMTNSAAPYSHESFRHGYGFNI